jgi:hypothetical protein
MSLATPPAPAPEKHLTRTGIMLALLPTVNAALAAVPGLVLTDKDVLRRTFRALLTIGIRLLLDAGAPPQAIAQEAMTAIANELKERADKAKEQGATQQPASA